MYKFSTFLMEYLLKCQLRKMQVQELNNAQELDSICMYELSRIA